MPAEGSNPDDDDDTAMEGANDDETNGKGPGVEEHHGRKDDDYDVGADEDWVS
jgi:hypothetical protein